MNRKRTAFLCAVLAVSGSLCAFSRAPYKDLASVANRGAIDYLYDIKCLDFIMGNEFQPQTPLTRGDLAHLLYNVTPSLSAVLTPQQKESAAAPFYAVEAAGILKADGKGDFRASEPLSVSEYAAALERYGAYSRLDMTPYTARFKEQPAAGEYMTRGAAAEHLFRIIKPDGVYVPHVELEKAAMKCLNDEYGSMISFFDEGTLYWDGDTLVIGLLDGSSRSLERRLKRDHTLRSVVQVKPVVMAKSEYDTLLRIVGDVLAATVDKEEYLGSLPDYKAQQIVVMTKTPLPADVLAELERQAGRGIVRNEDAVTAKEKVKETRADSGVREPVTARTRHRLPKALFTSSLLDRETAIVASRKF
ncbi:S-layer homology domain-containing protein [Colibacter massiliensis]|uniref:S-layer homology domain-containing protein n=1 Tax=Colibacter massiliensis TaxID=1852379 RepID=UPI003F8F1711